MSKSLNPFSSFAYKVSRLILRRCGLDVLPHIQGHHCVGERRGKKFHVIPDYVGRSSHKHFDIRDLPEFGALAREVIEHDRTYLYYDRLYTLYQALTNIKRLVESSGESDVGLAVGGNFVVDDFGSVTCEGIRQAVEEFVARKPNYFSFHLLTGQHLLVKCSDSMKR